MTQAVRQLDAAQIEAYTELVARAYPGFNLFPPENKNRQKESISKLLQHDIIKLYGFIKDDKLHGGMLLYDLLMNLNATEVPVGGVGLVAVDLLHKKEKVAKAMIQAFLRHCRAQGTPLAVLYPFSPEFYKKMGFGFGTKMHQYRIAPADLPHGGSKANVHEITPADREDVLACYERFRRRTNGMMRKEAWEHQAMFERPNQIGVAYRRDGQVQGYLLFQFERGEAHDFMSNDLLVRELVYENRDAFAELMTFLHSQQDQVRRVILNTQDDEFHHLLTEPRNGTGGKLMPVYHESHTTGVGVMYRVTDVRGLFEHLRGHDLGGQTVRFKLTVEDTLLPENSGSLVVHVADGSAVIADDGEHEVELRIGIADLSAWVVGSVSFRTLHRHGLAVLSDDAYAGRMQRLFATEDKPRCTTWF